VYQNHSVNSTYISNFNSLGIDKQMYGKRSALLGWLCRGVNQFGFAIAKGHHSESRTWDTTAVATATAKQLTTSVVASRIDSRPTSSSGLLSRPSWAAVGNCCSYMHRRRTYYLYCTLIYCHINLWKMLTLTRSLTLNPNPNLNCNCKQKP